MWFPLQSPVAHGFEEGFEGVAFFCELVGLAQRSIFGGHLLGDAVAEESGEAIAENVGGNALG